MATHAPLRVGQLVAGCIPTERNLAVLLDVVQAEGDVRFVVRAGRGASAEGQQARDAHTHRMT